MEQCNTQPTQEVVLCYVQEQPVTEYYVQPTPLPGGRKEPPRSEEKQKKRRRRGLRVFLISIGVLAVLLGSFAVIQHFWFDAPYDDYDDYNDYYDYYWSDDEEPEETTIPRYPNGGSARLVYCEEHGDELTAQQVYARVNPSTVLVVTGMRSGSAIGTGIIMTQDGYVLTNAHVIEGGSSCTVVLSSGESYEAQLVGFDAAQDIAVLKADATGLPAAEFGTSDTLVVGEKVYAIGNPLGVELRGTLTDGLISAINRDVEMNGTTMTLLQTNAALNSGNSGGPLINAYGQVIGINTMKMDTPRYSADVATVEGLGFAIPISSAAWMVNDLIAYGELRGEISIGITVLTAQRALPDGTSALEVYEVTPGSPGDEAGLQPGDLIITADGESLSTSGDLLRIRRRHAVGEALHLEVWRNGTLFETDVILRVGTT